jgi:hypothetical protein
MLKKELETGIKLRRINGRKYNEIVMQSNQAATIKSIIPMDEKLSELKYKNRIRVAVIMPKTMLNLKRSVLIIVIYFLHS